MRNLFRPATLSDLVRLCPVLPLRHWRGLAAQITAFPAFALERDGEPLLLVSIVPDPDGEIEACVIFGRKRPPVSAMRQLLLTASTFLPERTLTVRIHDENRKGHHMAVLTGFAPTEDVMEGTAIRAWARPPLEAET